MFKLPLRAPLLVLLAALLASCTTLGDLETPRIQVVNVQMLSTDMFAQRFKVRVQVQNPNTIELPIEGLDYTILMMGDSFAEGVSNDHFLLPALATRNSTCW